MREILFRGKRVDDGEWIYGHYVHQYGSDMIYLPDGVDHEYGFDYYHIDTETVGQFTGLTDKNGKRIFEGDIVRSCEYDDIYFVKYCADNNYPAFDVVPEINVECNGLSHLYFAEGMEVIGNIHDNPDYLKGEKYASKID